MSGNIVIIHGGGPTAVINASLYGAIVEARRHGGAGRIYAAIGGTGGLLRGRLRDLGGLGDAELSSLLSSPGSAIGTSRDGLKQGDYEAMLPVFERFGIKYVLMSGGNGTMDTCGRIEAASRALDIRVMGIPKTMDNDLSVTDHAPGFGSAARFLAGSVAEVCADVASLPIHVVVVEAMGRNAGWLTAASALARDSYGSGPDLLYVPELDFSEEAFLDDVSALIRDKGCGVVVVSEGAHGAGGKPIVAPVFRAGRDTYFGDVSSHLSNLIIKRLGFKSRSEKPGLLGRASIAWQSGTDRDEAVLAGSLACRAALEGESGKMVAFRRVSSEPYAVEPFLADIREVMMRERKLPANFLNEEGNGASEDYLAWCRPLLGAPLPRIADLRGE
jgi:ATP-dependent phosphofructokinase / diphosphate-dependent phosphofructokinase